MIIENYKFVQKIPYNKKNVEWKVENVTFSTLNLITGRNSTGKSRILNSINALAKILSKKRTIRFIGYTEWAISLRSKKDDIYYYEVKIDEESVLEEKLTINNQKVITRDKFGKGFILAKKINKGGTEGNLEFQVPLNELVVFVKRDAIQHPYLEPIFDWAENQRLFRFNESSQKRHFKITTEGHQNSKENISEHDNIDIFRKGIEQYKENFVKDIQRDMKTIGYNVEDIKITNPLSLKIEVSLPIGKTEFLCIQEDDLDMPTDQHEMSDGMYRAFSLITHINYLVHSKKPSCILIDDIGEGLDFERSCLLIKLLMKKAKKHKLQFITSSNDRFVMNVVPLESWIYLKRAKGGPKIYDINNSKDIFDKFKYTGLNNFDFLATDFVESQE